MRLCLIAIGALALLAQPSLAPAHHRPDESAGTIASFDSATGQLTIDLSGGGTVSGLVGKRTKIKCRHDHRHDPKAKAVRGRGVDYHPSSHGGRHSDPPGHDGTPPGASEGPGQGAKHKARCTTADLIVGAVVDEAELKLKDGGAFYKKVVLAGKAQGA